MVLKNETGCPMMILFKPVTSLKSQFFILALQENNPMELNCRDVGVDCDFRVIGASSEDEIMQLAAVHAKMAHNINQLSPDLVEKVKQGTKR
jgi:predicted small metal-binding protein